MALFCIQAATSNRIRANAFSLAATLEIIILKTGVNNIYKIDLGFFHQHEPGNIFILGELLL